jgi:polyisoprenoid-binding protein YceI
VCNAVANGSVRTLLNSTTMNDKWLSRIGRLAIAAFILGSFGALFVVSRRIQVTIAEEQATVRRGPDPLALVAADVAASREELRELGERLEEQLQSSHAAVLTASEQREVTLRADLARLVSELARLDARVAALSPASARESAAASHSLGEAAAAPPALAAGTGVSTGDSAAANPPPSTSPFEASERSAPAPAIGNTPGAPREKRFLSFKSAGPGFSFDALQRFALVPSLSRVGFDAKSTLHDFSGACTNVEGEIQVALARPAAGCSGFVRASAAALETGLAERDDEMRKVLGVAEFAEIRFDWKSFEPGEVDAAALRVTGTAHGDLTIHGKTRAVSLPVRVAVDASRRLGIEGELHVKMSDFGVAPPKKLGLISVDDEVVVWIALRARLVGPALEKRS